MQKVKRAKHKAPAIVRPPYEGSAKRQEIRNAVETMGAGPSLEEIARLAYSYWEDRSHQGGSVEEDWLRAEEELRQRDSKPT